MSLRLLLVELMADEPERQVRTAAYPFLLGLSRRLGWQASWCALGVRYEPTLRYSLGPADLAVLLAEVSRTSPSVVLLNERLPQSQLERVAQAAGGARVAYWDQPGDDVFHLAEAVARLVPEADGPVLREPGLLESIEPDFRRRVLNDAPWTGRRLVQVYCGARCTYRAAAAANPHYRGLGGPERMGCAFCGDAVDIDRSVRLEDPLAFAARQIAAACRRREGDAEPRFNLVGRQPWLRLEEFLAELLRRGVRGAELDFSPRVDELLARRAALARCLPRLARAGLAVRINGMGVENFSPAENRRLNKGIAPAQIHRACAFLLETAARWPENFRLPYGGLGMILFTPWTTTEDLLVNLRHIERCPLIDRAFALGRRLQLFPGRPILRLVEKDGLLARDWRDLFYNSGCILSADQKEIPWRFRHPEVAVLWRLARRLSSERERIPAGDPDGKAVAAFLAGQPRGGEPLDPLPIFRRAVQAMARRPRTRSVAALLKLL